MLEKLGKVEGVFARYEGDIGVVTFEDGLFASKLDTIGPKEEKRLERVGEVLQRQETPVKVLVEGHTDDIPLQPGITRWPDNWSLGLNRANTVLSFLRRKIDSGKVRLMACSAGEINPPFPNDSTANRHKNRTVLLYLTTDTDQASVFGH